MLESIQQEADLRGVAAAQLLRKLPCRPSRPEAWTVLAPCHLLVNAHSHGESLAQISQVTVLICQMDIFAKSSLDVLPAVDAGLPHVLITYFLAIAITADEALPRETGCALA